jgi:hypothetical protein
MTTVTLSFVESNRIWDTDRRIQLHFRDLSAFHPTSKEEAAQLMVEAIENKHFREHKAGTMKASVVQVTEDEAIIEHEVI